VNKRDRRGGKKNKTKNWEEIKLRNGKKYVDKIEHKS
jgi:hypothetical protein